MLIHIHPQPGEPGYSPEIPFEGCTGVVRDKRTNHYFYEVEDTNLRVRVQYVRDAIDKTQREEA